MPKIIMSDEIKESLSNLQIAYSKIPSPAVTVIISSEEELLSKFKDGKKDQKLNPSIYRRNANAILNWLVIHFPAIVIEVLQNYDEEDGVKAGLAVYARLEPNIKAAMNYLGNDCTPPKSKNCIDDMLYQQIQYLSWFMETVKIILTPAESGNVTNFAVKFGFNNYIKSFNSMLAFYEKEMKIPHQDYKAVNAKITELVKGPQVVKTDAVTAGNNPHALFSLSSSTASASASNDNKVQQNESKRNLSTHNR